MSSAIEIAAIGLAAQQRAVDAIASNISNVSTPAYKRSEVRFSTLVAASAERNSQTADEDPVAGVGSWSQPILEVQGQLQVTENPLDLAIDGTGFIELMGPAGTTLLWRGGALRVLEDGTLASAAGIPLKASISVPADATALRIERDGKVYATSGGSASESEIGALNLVKAPQSDGIQRLDGGVYAIADDTTLISAPAGEEGLGRFVQGSIERSNVDLNTEMVSLIVAQRAYAANAQVVRAADELLGIANNLRR